MKRTIYLPDDLAKRLNEYLKKHPEETLFSIVQQALAAKLARKDVTKLCRFSRNSPQCPSQCS